MCALEKISRSYIKMWAHIKRSFKLRSLSLCVKPCPHFPSRFLSLWFFFTTISLFFYFHNYYSRYERCSRAMARPLDYFFFVIFLSLSLSLCVCLHVGAWSSDSKCAGWRKMMIRNNYFTHWKLFSFYDYCLRSINAISLSTHSFARM